jgi:hypothetical protein
MHFSLVEALIDECHSDGSPPIFRTSSLQWRSDAVRHIRHRGSAASSGGLDRSSQSSSGPFNDASQTPQRGWHVRADLRGRPPAGAAGHTRIEPSPIQARPEHVWPCRYAPAISRRRHRAGSTPSRSSAPVGLTFRAAARFTMPLAQHWISIRTPPRYAARPLLRSRRLA